MGSTAGPPTTRQALVEHGIKRTLIAFDGDDAGDRGAKALATELTAVGVEVFRVELPRGVDVNDVAVEAKNPTDALGRFLRKAAWMGGTKTSRPAPASEPARVVPPGLDSPAHAIEPVEPTPVVVPAEDQVDEPEEPAESEGSVDSGDPSQVVGRELLVEFAERRWRVRGLDKVTSFDVLRVNLLVTVSGQAEATSPSSGSGFHVDTLDLYSARARAAFVAAAAGELRLAPEVVKADLGRVLLACESKAEEVIAAAQAPAKPEVRLTSAQRDAALDLLRDPDLIARIEKDFARVGMVGEQVNCLVGYLAAVSRLLPSPLAVIVQSTSAAGKSAVMESVLGFVPDEDRVSFSAMTGQSLFYLGESDLAHKVLSHRGGGRRIEGCVCVEAVAVGGRAVDRVDGQGHRVGAVGDPHLQGHRPDRDRADHDGDRRRRGAAQPLPGADG